MSQYVFEEDNKKFLCGYDNPMGFVFLVVSDVNGELLYSNINDEEINFWEQKDLAYFENIAKERFGVEIPYHYVASIKAEATNTLPY